METASALCCVKKMKQRKRASPRKQQSKPSDSSYCGAHSGSFVTPGMSEGIGTQNTNLESSLVMEGLIHSDNGSSVGSNCYPQQLQICPGFQANGEATMDSQNPPAQIWPDFAPFEDGWSTTASNDDYGDGLSIEDLWSWDELDQGNPLNSS